MSEPRAPLVTIGDLTIHDIDANETDQTIAGWLAERSAPRIVCTPNVDHVVQAHRDPLFRAAVQSCDLRVPDGMWIVYASRLAGRPLKASVTGRLLLPRLASYCREQGLAIALVGAGPGVADRAARRLLDDLPGLRIAHVITPPMRFEVGSDEDDADRATLDGQHAFGHLRRAGGSQAGDVDDAPPGGAWARRAHRRRAGLRRRGWPSSRSTPMDDASGTRVGVSPGQEPRRLARRYLVNDPWIFWWALRVRVGR